MRKKLRIFLVDVADRLNDFLYLLGRRLGESSPEEYAEWKKTMANILTRAPVDLRKQISSELG